MTCKSVSVDNEVIIYTDTFVLDRARKIGERCSAAGTAAGHRATGTDRAWQHHRQGIKLWGPGHKKERNGIRDDKGTFLSQSVLSNGLIKVLT